MFFYVLYGSNKDLGLESVNLFALKWLLVIGDELAMP